MISLVVGDLTTNARGLTVETEVAGVIVYGVLQKLAYLGDHVTVTLDGLDLVLPKAKPIQVSYEDARTWALSESDTETRGQILDAIADFNGQAVVFA